MSASVETDARQVPEERAPEAYSRTSRSGATRPPAAARRSAGDGTLISTGRLTRAILVGLNVALGATLLPSRAFADVGEKEELRQDEIPLKAKSAGMVKGGVVLMLLGAASVPAGLALISHGSTFTCAQECGPMRSPALVGIGAVMIGHGIASILASVPMMVIGGKAVPVPLRLSGPEGTPGLTLALAF